MRIEKKEKFNVLYADEDKHIREKNDIHKDAYIDEDGNKVEKYYPNYFTMAYVPFRVTEDNMNDLYVEEAIGESTEEKITTELKAQAYDILVGEVE